MKDKYYVVTMYKYGDNECHSYVYGIFDKKDKALKEAEAEQIARGGNKYYPEVLELTIGSSIHSSTYKIILEPEMPEWYSKLSYKERMRHRGAEKQITTLTLVVGKDTSTAYLNDWRYREGTYGIDLVGIIDNIKNFFSAKVLYLTKEAENRYRETEFPTQIKEYLESDFD